MLEPFVPKPITSRRAFLKRNSLLAAAAPFAITAARSEPAGPIAQTTGGKLRGRTENKIHVFRGVPYGADASGKNRFLPPRTPAPWQGTRDALEWGHVAPQAPGNPAVDYTRAVQWATLPGGMGEDCLVLNVWTPALKDGRQTGRPVFHSWRRLHLRHQPQSGVRRGGALARRGNVVVVTVNHRLGALGYLHLGELAPRIRPVRAWWE